MDIDLDLLEQLMALMRAQGAEEIRSGDFYLKLGRSPVENSTTAVVGGSGQITRKSLYEGLFGGRVPSFDDFKQAGMVIEE